MATSAVVCYYDNLNNLDNLQLSFNAAWLFADSTTNAYLKISDLFVDTFGYEFELDGVFQIPRIGCGPLLLVGNVKGFEDVDAPGLGCFYPFDVFAKLCFKVGFVRLEEVKEFFVVGNVDAATHMLLLDAARKAKMIHGTA